MKVTLRFADEDACFDALKALENFKIQNLHPEHNGDIDRVKFEKPNATEIVLTGDGKEAIDYVADYAAETDLDRFRGRSNS